MNQLDITKNYSYNYNNLLKNVIPLLVERKYCYNTPQSKGPLPDETSPQSKYSLFGSTTKPMIKREIQPSNSKQHDDYLKENVVNAFSALLLNEVIAYDGQSQAELSNSQTSSNLRKLNKHQKNIIKDLNMDLNHLNNKRHKNTLSYSMKDFNKHKYMFYRNIIINTILVFAIIFTLNSLSSGDVPVLPKSITLYVNMTIIGIYMIILIVSLNSIRDRNKTNWNQYNFRNIKIEQKV